MAKYTHKKRQAIAETKPGQTLSRAQEGELTWLREAFQSLGRRTTAQAYEVGGRRRSATSSIRNRDIR